MPRIKEMFAFITEENGPGDEGLIGIAMNGQWMPFVGADMERANALKPLARSIGEATHKKIKLVRFSVREELEEL